MPLSSERFFDTLSAGGPSWPPVLGFPICYQIATLIDLIATAPFFVVPAPIPAADGSPEGGLVPMLTPGFFPVFFVAVYVLFVVLFFAGVPFRHAFACPRGAIGEVPGHPARHAYWSGPDVPVLGTLRGVLGDPLLLLSVHDRP